jgi:hypothetical protein
MNEQETGVTDVKLAALELSLRTMQMFPDQSRIAQAGNANRFGKLLAEDIVRNAALYHDFLTNPDFKLPDDSPQ